MFSSHYLNKNQQYYGVDLIEFKNCYEIQTLSKGTLRCVSNESALNSRSSKIFQNAFLLELLVKQTSFFYLPKKKGQKLSLFTSKIPLKKLRLKVFLNILLVLKHRIFKNFKINETGNSIRFFFKDPLNFPKISNYYSLFVGLGSVNFNLDLTSNVKNKHKKSILLFFLKLLTRK